jgi:hypothetical protein
MHNSTGKIDIIRFLVPGLFKFMSGIKIVRIIKGYNRQLIQQQKPQMLLKIEKAPSIYPKSLRKSKVQSLKNIRNGKCRRKVIVSCYFINFNSLPLRVFEIFP